MSVPSTGPAFVTALAGVVQTAATENAGAKGATFGRASRPN
jgi:hypothetical protein